MYSEKLDDLLKRNETLINDINVLDNSNFNIFHVLGCSRYEVRHSSFLAWLLKKKEFLKRFAKECGIDLEESSLASIDVETEESYKVKDIQDKIDSAEFKDIVLKGYKENNQNRYIDINIKGVDFSLTIENKVDSSEHDDQCISYYNYMMIDPYGRYKGAKKKHFVFLAKDKPEYFELLGGLGASDKCKEAKEFKEGMKYYNYRLITYRQILGILEDFTLEKENENEIVQQYKAVLSEWEELPNDYRNVICRINQGDLIQIEDKYSDWRNNDENTKEMRFLDVAYQYYKQEKKKYDDMIKPALSEILSDEIAIKTSYGRGSYANALPISLNFLGDDEKIDYCIDYSKKKSDTVTISNIVLLREQKSKLDDDNKRNERLKNSIKRKIKKLSDKCSSISDEQEKSAINWEISKLKEKEKTSEEACKESKVKFDKITIELDAEKDKVLASNCLKEIEEPMLQTVDFRSPMLDEHGKFSVATLAGFRSNYSKALCKNIINGNIENTKVYREILSNRNYKITFSYSFGNGAGYGDKETFECNMNNFAKYCTAKGIKGTNDGVKNLFIRKLTFEEIFKDDFLGFLKDLKDNDVMGLTEVKDLIKKALDYFLNEDKITFSHDSLQDKSDYFEDPVVYAHIEKNIKMLVPDFDLNPYKERLLKKIGIAKASAKLSSKERKEKDTTNKELNFVWQLLLSYTIDETSPSEEMLKKVYYEETKRGLSFFGHDELCKKLLK